MVSSFVSIRYHCRAFASSERPCYSFSVMKQNTPDILRLRTFIFPGEEQKAYVESKNGCYIPFLVTLGSDADFFISALNPALFLLSFSFCSLVNGTLPLKILSAHSHRQSTRLRSALVMRCLRIHGFVFCKFDS
jgi:hypothetical protein